MIKEIETLSELIFVMQQSRSKTILISFLAKWSNPCRQMKLSLDDFSTKNSEIGVYSMNIENENLSHIFNIYSITVYPTTCLFRQATLISKFPGYCMKPIENYISKN